MRELAAEMRDHLLELLAISKKKKKLVKFELCNMYYSLATTGKVVGKRDTIYFYAFTYNYNTPYE